MRATAMENCSPPPQACAPWCAAVDLNLDYEEGFFKTMVSSSYNFGVGTKVLTPKRWT